jgi:ABC-2 type transport system permease protein
MISSRIKALLIRYYYSSASISRLTEYLFWPLVDIAFYGLIAMWSQNIANEPQIMNIFIMALILWQLIHRSHMEICHNLMVEFTDRNFMNFVASPLREWEWILGLMLSGAWKTFLSLAYCCLIAYLLFGVNFFSLGTGLLVFIPLCIINGWITGLIAGGFVVSAGAKTYQVPWVIIMIAALLSTLFYPIEILPTYYQYLVASFPMTYIFQQMRFLLTTKELNIHLLWLGSLLTALYLAIALKFFMHMFKRSRILGFKKLS